jgi:PAS domain S-box-containing protein
MTSGSLTVALKETLDVFERVGPGTPLTTNEVTAELDVGRRSTYDRLERLADEGLVETKSVGSRGRVWWRPVDAREESSEPTLEASYVDDVPGMVYRCETELPWPMEFVSARSVDVTGYEPAAFEAGEVEWATDVVHPDDVDAVRDEVERGLASSGEFTTEYRIVDAEDETRWVRERGHGVGDGVGGYDAVQGVVVDVTDRRRTETSLRESRQKFETLVDAVEEYAIFALDADGRVRTWNEGARAIKGYEEEAVLGEHISTFYTDEDGAAGVPERNLEAAREEGTTEDEGWRVRADGSRFWAHVTISAVRDDEGTLTGFTKVTRDMTERRERERTVQRERDLLDQVLETSPFGLGVVGPSGRVERVNRRFGELLGVSAEETESYELGDKPLLNAEGDPIPLDERPAMRTLETGDSVSDVRVRVEDGGTTRWLSVDTAPIERDDGWGVVIAMTDVTQLEGRARRLERQREGLASELDEVFSRVDDAFYALDDEWRFTYVNDRAEALLGEPRPSLLGSSIWDVFPEAEKSDGFEAFQRAKRTQDAVTYEEYFAELDAWFEVRVYPSESGLSVYFADVTGRKQRERELERYETIVETVDDGIYAVDAEARFVLVNDAFCDLVGYDREELLGERATTVHDAEVTRQAERLASDIVEGRRDVGVVQLDLQTKSGGEVPVESRLRPVSVEQGVGRCGVVRDVSDRIERERELREYERIVETVDDGVYVLDGDGRFRRVNQAFVGMTRYSRGELIGAHASTVFGSTFDRLDAEARRQFADGEAAVATFTEEIYPADEEEITVESRFKQYRVGDERGRVGVVRDVTERERRKCELERRVRQQDVVTDLGQRALEDRALNTLFDDAVSRLAETLDADYCKVLDLDEADGTLLLRSGVGWDDGLVGSARVAASERDSQAAYTLETDEAVVVEDLNAESRFSGPDLLRDHDVTSGVSVIVGSSDEPWGILGVHDTDRRTFDAQDVTVVQSVANILTTAIDRREHEQEIDRQRRRLAALDDLNGVVRDITEAVVEQSTRGEIETVVCESLAASDSYAFAWIGGVDAQSQTVDLHAEAGVEGYLDGVTISTDPDDERSRGPTGRAVVRGEMQTTRDARSDAAFDPWREHVDEYGFRSSAAIPVAHEGTVYGVLNVYTERCDAFTGDEAEVVAHLGDVVGHAIAAVERKRALMSEEVVELEYAIPDVFAELDAPTTADGRFTVEQVVPVEDEEYLAYGTVDGDMIGVLEGIVETLPYWESLSVYGESEGSTRFELRLDDPPVLGAVTAHGGYVERVVVDDGDYYMRIHLAPNVDTRRVDDVVRGEYPAARMVSKQQRSRRDRSPGRFDALLGAELTERQRAAIEAAFFAGYFEWPRENSGEDVADSLGVSPPTFHQHLRHALRRVLEVALGQRPAA